MARIKRLGASRPIPYSTWRETHILLTAADQERITRLATRLPNQPSFTLVTEVDSKTDVSHLRFTLESVAKQLWPEWVLCLTTDVALSGHLAEIVTAMGDARVRVTGPDPAVLGDWAAWVPAGDVLHEACLFALAHAVTQNPEAVVAYTDNDHVDSQGCFLTPHAKPDWNPDLLAGQYYLGGLVSYRCDVVDGGPGCETPP